MVMEFTTDEELRLWDKTLSYCYDKDIGEDTLVLIKDEAPEECKEFYKKYLGKKSKKDFTNNVF